MALLCLVASISSCFASPTESEMRGLDEIATEMHENYNYGDCYTNAQNAAQLLANRSYRCAIVQGISDIPADHRAVLVRLSDGITYNFESQCAAQRGYWNVNWWNDKSYEHLFELTVIEIFNNYPYKSVILNHGDSIQNAIDSLSDGDIIYLNGGTYNEFNINVNKRVTIKASGVNGFPIIDAQGNGRVFALSNGATLKDLVIAGGYSDNGAGVYNDQGIISHCTLIYNTATGSGGGVFNRFGTVNDYCLIQDNYAIDGAGVLNLGGNVNVCTIAGNIATNNGGGVNSNGIVSNCFIAYNTALTGGGLFKSGGTVTGCSYTDNYPNDLYVAS